MRSASTRCRSSRRIEQAHAGAAQLGERLAHGRQLRRDDRRQLGVVEADHREIVRDLQPAPVRGVQHADRDVVVEAEDRGRRVGQRQQLLGRLGAARHPPVGVGDELGVEQHPRGRERGAEADQPLLGRIPAGRAGDRADPAVAEAEQMLGRLLRSGGVHRRDARDAVGRRLARVDDHEREALPLQHEQLVGATPPAASGSRRRSSRASAARAARPRGRARAASARARAACRARAAPRPRRSASGRSRRRRRAAASGRSSRCARSTARGRRGSC